MTYFAMDYGLWKHGLNVSMAVWQLPLDKFVVFFAREEYIPNLRSPAVTKDLRGNMQAFFRKVKSFAMDQVCDQPRLMFQ